MTPNEILQAQYEKCCNDYIKEFAKKQDLEFEFWVGDKVGGIASFSCVYYFNFRDIVWDINSNQPKGLIENWLYDSLEDTENAISYHSYSKRLRANKL